MWVKTKRSGLINWFANGKKGHKIFYTKTNGTVIPAKVWTHVAGTFDSITGMNIMSDEVVRMSISLKSYGNWLNISQN